MGLLQDLQNHILIADGAMGTLLYSFGIDRCFDELNVSKPEEIERIHSAYLDAGATVIQTNTYGANRIKLARYGLEDDIKIINQKGVELAKRALQKRKTKGMSSEQSAASVRFKKAPSRYLTLPKIFVSSFMSFYPKT